MRAPREEWSAPIWAVGPLVAGAFWAGWVFLWSPLELPEPARRPAEPEVVFSIAEAEAQTTILAAGGSGGTLGVRTFTLYGAAGGGGGGARTESAGCR